ESDLLIDPTAGHFSKDLSLPRCESGETINLLLDEPRGGTLCRVPIYCRSHGVDEHLISNGLREEVYSTRSHRLHGHRDVAVPGEEDDWLGVAAIGHLTLQIEPTCSRHPHIEDEAAGTIQQ